MAEHKKRDTAGDGDTKPSSQCYQFVIRPTSDYGFEDWNNLEVQGGIVSAPGAVPAAVVVQISEAPRMAAIAALKEVIAELEQCEEIDPAVPTPLLAWFTKPIASPEK